MKIPTGTLFFVAMLTATTAQAACPYSSVQIRVQPNTATPWSSSTTVPIGQLVHVGVFKNGWGVPVDPGTVQVFAAQGAYYLQIGLTNGWEAWLAYGAAATWNFYAYCGGAYKETAYATWSPSYIDVLSYVKPGGANGVDFSVITNQGNPWRTYSKNNGSIGERLPGFFITKGGVEYLPNMDRAWNFETLIYDNSWIWLVRDTSWPKKCKDNLRPAGMLLFTYVNGTWVRGGRHFPRFIQNGGIVDTGEKWVQGVEKKTGPNDTAQEGRWCDAENSGMTSSRVQANLIPFYTVGGQTLNDVLKLSIVGGSGAGDNWWFAKGVGLIAFQDSGMFEYHTGINSYYPIEGRIPCEPNLPCM